jgi:hypothetical protein
MARKVADLRNAMPASAKAAPRQLAAYLVSVDNVSKPLSTRLHRANQRAISTRDLLSTPGPSLLTSI